MLAGGTSVFKLLLALILFKEGVLSNGVCCVAAQRSYGLLICEVSRTHMKAPKSVGLLDECQLIAVTST